MAKDLLTFLDALRKWWQTWQCLPVLTWVRAARYYRNASFKIAADLYAHGLKSNSNHPAANCARLDLAYCYFRLAEFDKAEELLKQVVQRAPQLREAHIRYVKLQLWVGKAGDAVWAAKRALERFDNDAQLIAHYVFALIDHGGPAHLFIEAAKKLNLCNSTSSHPKLEVAKSLLAIQAGDYASGFSTLEKLANIKDAQFESVLYYAAELLKEDRIAEARHHLRRLLENVPNHPMVQTLLSQSYLKSGPLYNAEFALQLALSAAQHSGWASARALHILAEAYYHLNDRSAALLAAFRAKSLSQRPLAPYRDARELDRLIDSLANAA